MQDMDLIFYNCGLYNGTQTEVGQYGVRVKKVWTKAWQRSGLAAGGVHSYLVLGCLHTSKVSTAHVLQQAD